MNATLGFIDMLLPKWALALLLAGALLNGCHTSHQRDVARVERADLKAAAEKLRADTAEVARKDAVIVGEKQFTHATNQQENVDVYAQKIATLEAARRADAVTAVSLRSTIAAYVANSRTQTQSDPATCQRQDDRLSTLGELLAEGADLVAEGRQLVRRRDAEIGLLLPLIVNDRQLLTP